MSVYFNTFNSSTLLTAFKKAIDDKKVMTWAYDSDGDFYHTPEQWKSKGYLRPKITNGCLTLNFLGRKTEVTTWEIYGVLQGRFIESMVAHCHDLFSEGVATAKPTSSDIITSSAA